MQLAQDSAADFLRAQRTQSDLQQAMLHDLRCGPNSRLAIAAMPVFASRTALTCRGRCSSNTLTGLAEQYSLLFLLQGSDCQLSGGGSGSAGAGALPAPQRRHPRAPPRPFLRYGAVISTAPPAALVPCPMSRLLALTGLPVKARSRRSHAKPLPPPQVHLLDSVLRGCTGAADVLFYVAGTAAATAAGVTPWTRAARLPLLSVFGSALAAERLLPARLHTLLHAGDRGQVRLSHKPGTMVQCGPPGVAGKGSCCFESPVPG